ncbi:MAG: hypothetical protein DRQ02_08150 [Candidatus Latescibacterota bacterium]|nr:MAG: hypothetical protein DRQ02_08150 [Candidatus Latescibacterota bacterium]
MKKTLALSVAFAFVVGVFGIASAHIGTTIYVQNVDPAKITIDGLNDDWLAAGYEVTFTQDDMEDVLGGEMQPLDDFACVGYCGWSLPPDNMLYWYIAVTDDIHNADTPDDGGRYKDDNVEMGIDADHSGGNYREGIHGEQAQQLGFLPTPGAGIAQNYHWGDAALQWIVQEPYCYVAFNIDDLPNYACEGKMAIWDRADVGGPEASDRHVLTAGETIGWMIQIDDVDETPDTRDCQPGLEGSEGGRSWTDASQFNDAVLLPPSEDAVEPSTWGGIKALFE